MIASSLTTRDTGKFAFVRRSVVHAGLGPVLAPLLAPALVVVMLAASMPAFAHGTDETAQPASTASAASNEKVAKALAQGDIDTATAILEAAVTKAPRDPVARVALGKVYLRAGRFESAVTMLGDARKLGDDSGHTALGLALAQIASGHGADAVAVLDGAHDTIPVSDYGLALAMAGETARGIAVLNDAVHGAGANPKMRQNLAYAYALAGRWAEAKQMAGLDLASDKLDDRMAQWADTSRPEASRKRVAALIGVPLRDDAGAPLSLALATAPADTAPSRPAPASSVQASSVQASSTPAVAAPASPDRVAVAQPVAAQPAVVQPATAPVDPAPKTDANGELPPVDHVQPPAVLAAAAPAPVAVPAPEAATAPESLSKTLLLHRANTTMLVGVAMSTADRRAARRHHGHDHAADIAVATPAAPVEANAKADVAASAPPHAEPQLDKARHHHAAALADANTPGEAAKPAEAHARKASHHGADRHEVANADISAPVDATTGPATHLVQLGSFSSQQNAEHARQTFLARDPSLGRHQFVITQAFVKGHNFWRVAVMGFDASSASHTCGSIRQHGGACFAYAAGHLPGGQALALATTRDPGRH